MYKNVVVIIGALISAGFAGMLVIYISIDPSILFETSNEVYVYHLSKLNLLWILTSVDFWNLPIWHFLRQPYGVAAFINFFSALSLVIFCTGLFIYNLYLNHLAREYVGGLFLFMGCAHVVLSKIILLYEPPVLLTGPVLAVGLISLLYFSIVAFFISISYVIWIIKK